MNAKQLERLSNIIMLASFLNNLLHSKESTKLTKMPREILHKYLPGIHSKKYNFAKLQYEQNCNHFSMHVFLLPFCMSVYSRNINQRIWKYLHRIPWKKLCRLTCYILIGKISKCDFLKFQFVHLQNAVMEFSLQYNNMLAILAGYLLLLIPLTSLSANYFKEEIKPTYFCDPNAFYFMSPSFCHLYKNLSFILKNITCPSNFMYCCHLSFLKPS